MIKTLTTYDEGLALILDKPMLELLGIDADTPISVSTDGKALILSPVFDAERGEKLMKIRAKVNNQYGATFRNLAD